MDIEIIKGLTYQGIKKILDNMNDEELTDVESELDNILSNLYSSVSLFGEDTDLTIKEYQIMMKGIKKLEIIKGFMIDRIEGKSYMEYKKII